MTVQNHVDILRNIVWRNMDKSEPDTVSFQIECERPIEIAVAIAPDNGDRGAERLNCMQDARRADIAEVPDLVGAGSDRLDFGGQLIVRIGEN